MTTPAHSPTTGVLAMLATATIWGLFPLYLHLLSTVGADLIMAHRIVWSAAIAWALLFYRHKIYRITRHQMGLLICTALLLSSMWTAYVWSVVHHRVIDLSLGYFLMPLLATLLSVLFLGEKLSRQEQAAVGLALFGLSVLLIGKGGLPLNGLIFAVSFAGYATLRKQIKLDPLLSLGIEVGLLTPAALIYLAAIGAPAFTAFPLQMGSAILTMLPMLLYGIALGAIRLTTASMINYLTPTLNFLCGLLFFAEPLDLLKLFTFVCIWGGLLVYSHAAYQRSRTLTP